MVLKSCVCLGLNSSDPNNNSNCTEQDQSPLLWIEIKSVQCFLHPAASISDHFVYCTFSFTWIGTNLYLKVIILRSSFFCLVSDIYVVGINNSRLAAWTITQPLSQRGDVTRGHTQTSHCDNGVRSAAHTRIVPLRSFELTESKYKWINSNLI